MINIVIVDSGVCITHPIFENSIIDMYQYQNGELLAGGDDSFGHGTAIAGIIHRTVHDAKITMIKIDNIESGVIEDDIISVLNCLVDWDNINIINLSLGTCICDNYHELYDVCQRLYDKGVIVVSAFDNSGSISYPAAFDNVIGVVSSPLCVKSKQFCYMDDSVVNIAAKGGVQGVAWTTPEYLLMGGNSLACAHVTAQIAEFMKQGIFKRSELLDKLKSISIKQYYTNTPSIKNYSFTNIEKAVLFPFNKEMHSLIRFADDLDFEIVDVYDSKYSSTVGATTRQILRDKTVKDIKIKRIESIDWDDFDTLILGHTDELSTLINKKALKKDLIDTAIGMNKKVYSFDDLGKLGYEKTEKIYYPSVSDRDLLPNRFGMLYRISKPVLGIFGTSSRQGKFTLQMLIRKRLIKLGYNVGQIGTEPSALLYGMDAAFPMGYNSSVYLKENDNIYYLNNLINDLCLMEKDIIIVGSQSGTIQYDTGNISQYCIPQYHFLLGTQPDAVILCINPFDELHYIKRTINFIESCADSKVFALVVFPLDIGGEWSIITNNKIELTQSRYIEIKSNLSKEFNLPVFQLGNDADMDDLIKCVIDQFSE